MHQFHKRRSRPAHIPPRTQTENLLLPIADRLNQDIPCAWCRFPARPYGGGHVEENAVWVHHLPGLPSPWQCAVHTACLPGFQQALTARESDWLQHMRRYCVDGSHEPGYP